MERKLLDGVYGFGEGIGSRFAGGELDDAGFLGVREYAVVRTEVGVVFIDDEGFKIVTFGAGRRGYEVNIGGDRKRGDRAL